MKRMPCTGALLVLVAMTAACSFKIFEDIGSDPHPPTVEITKIIHYVVAVETPAETPTEETPAAETPTADKAASSPQGRSITWDSGGFTLTTDQLFQLGVAYTDAGGDIVKIHIRDRDGLFQLDLLPIDLTYFSGTSGAGIGPVDGVALTGNFGRHRLELWAEDSHLSRSEKVEFVITLVGP